MDELMSYIKVIGWTAQYVGFFQPMVKLNMDIFYQQSALLINLNALKVL